MARLLKKIRKAKFTYLIAGIAGALLLAAACPLFKGPLDLIFGLPLNALNFLKGQMGSVVLSLPNSIQNDRLIKENAQLRQKMESLKELYFENQRLKKLLAFKQDSVFKLVASRVIGRLPDNWSSGVIIDKGSFSGIRRGMPVITYDCLVGRVAEVEKFFSKVTLITDPGLGVSALIQRSRQEGLVCGTLGLYLMMKYLPQDADAQEGDLVVTSGLNSQYPKGISIGKVSYIAKDSSGLSSYCLITPERNLSRIEEVMVVLQ